VPFDDDELEPLYDDDDELVLTEPPLYAGTATVDGAASKVNVVAGNVPKLPVVPVFTGAATVPPPVEYMG